MNASPWYLLILSLPTSKASLRMRLWRTMNSYGCALLRDGVYLIPATAVAEQVWLGLIREVQEAGGVGYGFHVAAGSPEQEAGLKLLFDRTRDYDELMDQVTAFLEILTTVQAPVAGKQLQGLQRRLGDIRRMDFFPGDSASRAEQAVACAMARFHRLHSPDEPHGVEDEIFPRDATRYQGRVWFTRSRLWIDRLASAWLIERFVDRQARLLFLDDLTHAPGGAVGFDFDGAEFTHVGERVTFQTLTEAFSLQQDGALVRLGQLVHQLDVGVGRMAEAGGLLALLAGARRRGLADADLYALAAAWFDNLYAAFGPEPGGPTGE